MSYRDIHCEDNHREKHFAMMNIPVGLPYCCLQELTAVHYGKQQRPQAISVKSVMILTVVMILSVFLFTAHLEDGIIVSSSQQINIPMRQCLLHPRKRLFLLMPEEMYYSLKMAQLCFLMTSSDKVHAPIPKSVWLKGKPGISQRPQKPWTPLPQV